MDIEQKPNAFVRSATVAEGCVRVVLSDGRHLSTPLEWYPTLARASQSDLDDIEVSPFGLHWEKLDEDLGLAGMLAGRKSEKIDLSDVKEVVFQLAEYREQRRLTLLANSFIDYPDQQEFLSRFVNE